MTPDDGPWSDYTTPAQGQQTSGPWADYAAQGKPVDYGTALQYGIANAVPFSHDIGAAIQAGETYLPKSLRPDDTGPESPDGASFGDRFAAQRQRIGDTQQAVNAQYPYTSAVAPIA